MFGYKSAGIAEELVNALPLIHPHGGHGRVKRVAIVPEAAGVVRRNETYIAPTQFTVASMPFFRWSQ